MYIYIHVFFEYFPPSLLSSHVGAVPCPSNCPGHPVFWEDHSIELRQHLQRLVVQMLHQPDDS